MYILSNAIKNIGRNKGRNILMAVIVFAIILTTVVSIIINTTTAAIIEDYKNRFGSEVTLSIDQTKLPTKSEDFKEPTVEQKLSFGESDLLQRSEYLVNLMAVPKDLKAIDEDAQNQGGISMAADVNGGTGEVDENMKMVQPSLTLYGSSRADINDDFKEGRRKLTQGAVYNGLNECIISEEFAKLNNLKVGDSMSINSMFEKRPMTQELKITGIFQDNFPPNEQDAMFKSPMMAKGNQIFTTIETLLGMEMFKETGYMESTYYLKSPENLQTFQKELTEKGLPSYYKAATDEAGYKKVVGPVVGLSKISTTFLVVVLVLGSLILILLSVLGIRERKYEIGVLRAMGMKKAKVALGLLCEMVVITAVCLAAGLGAGAAASQPVADVLLQGQIKVNEEVQTQGGGVMMVESIGGAGSSQLEPLSELQIQLSGSAVGQIALVSLLIAGVSSLAGILYITKFEPNKILSERN